MFPKLLNKILKLYTPIGSRGGACGNLPLSIKKEWQKEDCTNLNQHVYIPPFLLEENVGSTNDKTFHINIFQNIIIWEWEVWMADRALKWSESDCHCVERIGPGGAAEVSPL